MWEKGAIKLLLDFPLVKRTDLSRPHHLKFIALKNVFITVRFEDMQAIDHFQRDFEIITILKKSEASHTGGRLLLMLLLRLYKSLDDKLDYLSARLQDIDTEVFKGREKEMVTDIAGVGRRLISFRQALDSHERVLGLLYTHISEAFDKSYQPETVRISEQYMHVVRRISRVTLALQELRETNNSLITTKQNEIMKTLTIMAFITFPLTLVSSIFGMNTVSTPIVGSSSDFWIIISFMSSGFVCFFIYFKYKHWI
jgi:magnesium transporter